MAYGNPQYRFAIAIAPGGLIPPDQEIVNKTEKALSEQGLSLDSLSHGLKVRMDDPSRSVWGSSGKTLTVNVQDRLKTHVEQVRVKGGKVNYVQSVRKGEMFIPQTLSYLERSIHPLRKTDQGVQLSVERRFERRASSACSSNF